MSTCKNAGMKQFCIELIKSNNHQHAEEPKHDLTFSFMKFKPVWENSESKLGGISVLFNWTLINDDMSRDPITD